MLKRITFILLSLALFMNSCQNGLDSESTTIVLTPTQQTSLPSETVASPTSTRESEPEPTGTNRPGATGIVPQCFISSSEASPFAFMPDSARIVIKEQSGVRIFNVETMEEERFLQTPPLPGPIALSPDGGTLAWALEDYTIQLVRSMDGELIHTLEGHFWPVTKLRFSSSGDNLFSASMDTWVRVWDLNGELVDSFEPTGANNSPNEIQGIGISPDEKMLGSVPFDGPARVWNLADKQEIVNLGGTGGDVTSDFAFSADGQFVAADQAGRLSVWRTSDWKKIGPEVLSMAFAFSPDGRFLAYHDSVDSNVYLHSLAETEEIRDLEGAQTFIYDLFFSPDGTLLASGGAGIQIWQVETGQLLYVGKDTCP